ncbi:MAG: glycosyltransferase family 4 protein [Alphaproteobacteria bacterium]
MKVLVVTHYYPAHGGGIELVARQLLLTMRQVAPGIDFTWAATACDPVVELPGVTYLPMGGTNIIERKYGVPMPVWSPRALMKLARAVREHDALWLHDTLYSGNIAAYLFAKVFKRPVVITQHIGAVPYQNRLLRDLMRHGNRWIAAKMLQHADQTVFIAAQVQDYFSGLIGKWKHAPQLIPNGVLTSVFKPVTSDRRHVLRQKFGLDEQPAMLFVGRFVEKKGLPALKRLAASLPEYDWMFAGRGPLDPALWGLRNCMAVRDRNGAGVAELYQAADLLVLPSSGEGFPLVVQEAAACGLPILCGAEIAGADARLPEILFTETVDSADPEATAARWAERIKAVLADPEKLETRRAELAAFALSNWSWPDAVENYAAIFRGLIP